MKSFRFKKKKKNKQKMVKSVMANVIEMAKIKAQAGKHLLEFTLLNIFLVKQ